MKYSLRIICTLLLVLGLSVQDAEARRLGGASSKGVQRESVTQRQVSPQPTAPTQQVAPHPATPTPVPTARHSWFGPLAGLAAGLGLGALLSFFGLGESMASLIGALLLIAAGILLLWWFFRRGNRPAPGNEPNLHFAGVGGPGLAPLPAAQLLELPPAPVLPASSIPRNIPAGFDQESFLRVARQNFSRLQAANDAGNLETIGELSPPEMLAEFGRAIAGRQGAGQQTDIVSLDAELLAVTIEADQHLASVRFHGRMREDVGQPALPFDEVWHLTQPADGSRGWVVAGIQQLD
ncbi:MAG: Tim44 domain-containing protein [Bacteroidota bacterium]